MKRLPDKKKFVPIGIAAETLGISIDTLRRWEKQGTIQAIRFANKRYFSLGRYPLN
jgi:DNA-binding transcriptional MerR regulator